MTQDCACHALIQLENTDWSFCYLLYKAKYLQVLSGKNDSVEI